MAAFHTNKIESRNYGVVCSACLSNYLIYLSIYQSDDNNTEETTEKRPIVPSTVRPSACSANPLDMCMYEPPSNAHLTDALDTSEL